MIQIIDDPRFSEQTSLVGCPRCKSECKEIWQTHKKNGKIRFKFKRLYVICKNERCRFDLASIKQPEGPLMIKL